MKLEKAIELLTTMKKVCNGLFPSDQQDAVSLGIEALKRVKACRPVDPYSPVIRLPGETDERAKE